MATASAFGCFRDHDSHDDVSEQWRCIREHFAALEELATAARCYYTCTGIPCTKDDLQNCRDNLNRAILDERELWS